MRTSPLTLLKLRRLAGLSIVCLSMLMSFGAAQSETDSLEAQTTPQRLFGAYTYGGVWHGMDPVLELEGELGRRLDIVHWFMNWQHDFDANLIVSASAGGRLPMLAWQPHIRTIEDIAAGQHDDYILSWAQGAAAIEGDIYIRPFPEMNGDWVAWNGNPEAFNAAWRHTVTLFREAGAHNVKWVWSPNVTDWPRTPENAMERYYPGTDYVDILALDGYNWGTASDWSTWRSFEEVFSAPYERIAAIGPQPIWAAELASTEHGGDKDAWVQGMFTSTAFPRLEALVWFNEDKETDWRINSSATALEAFRSGLVDGDTELAGSN